MRSKTSQLSAARERQLPDPGKNQLENLIEADLVPENIAALRAAERKAVQEEAAYRALHREFKALDPVSRGALVCMWSDLEGHDVNSLATRFGFEPGTLRVNKFRALALNAPCIISADDEGCTRQSHCAHVVGLEVYKALLGRAAESIVREVNDELGPERDVNCFV